MSKTTTPRLQLVGAAAVRGDYLSAEDSDTALARNALKAGWQGLATIAGAYRDQHGADHLSEQMDRLAGLQRVALESVEARG